MQHIFTIAKCTCYVRKLRAPQFLFLLLSYVKYALVAESEREGISCPIKALSGIGIPLSIGKFGFSLSDLSVFVLRNVWAPRASPA